MGTTPRWLRSIPFFLLLPPAGAADVPQKIEEFVREHPLAGAIGIQVAEVATGKVLYAMNGDRLLLPASNLKILTSALALERLGANYRFTTRVVREASGDVVLVGAGDPSLSGRVFPYQKDSRSGPPLAAIEELAGQIAARGIRRIDGDIVGDDGLYPWDPFPPSWTQDDAIRDFGAPVSALSLNENVIALSVAAGARVGDAATVSVSPAFEYLTFDNRVVTSAGRGETNVQVRKAPGAGQWILAGTVAFGRAGAVELLPVEDPALFAATALYDALARRGIAIYGHPVARHRVTSAPYTTPSGQELAARISPPLTDVVQTMNKVSQNLYAELLLREVGRVSRHSGTTQAGLAEMQSFLADSGGVPGDWRLEDGSGLSRNTLVTPRLLTQILVRMAQSKDAALWASLLPVGGEDGTLSRRLCCMSQGRGIRAKTGSLSRALALSGYAENPDRGPLAFSILVNDFAAPAAEVREWIDKIALALLD